MTAIGHHVRVVRVRSGPSGRGLRRSEDRMLKLTYEIARVGMERSSDLEDLDQVEAPLPRSYFEMKDCGLPSTPASWACVMPRAWRASTSQSQSRR